MPERGQVCLQTGDRVARSDSPGASSALLVPALAAFLDDLSNSLRGSCLLTLVAAFAFSPGLALRRVSGPHAVGSDRSRHLGPGWR